MLAAFSCLAKREKLLQFSEHQTSPRNLRSLDSVVTSTCYSSESGKEGQNLVSDPPFSNVKSLVCFRPSVESQQPFYEDEVIVLTEYRTHSGYVISDHGEKLARKLNFKILSLILTASRLEE